MNLHTVQ